MTEKFSLDAYRRAVEKMIATNTNAYSGFNNRQNVSTVRDYTPAEIQRIVKSGNLTEQQQLSRNYFYKDGLYRRIILHYATLLKYSGLLIPNPKLGKSLSNPMLNKRYYSALDFVEDNVTPELFTDISLEALINGCYYGVLLSVDKKGFVLLKLPPDYCCSRFKDVRGNDIIEFDVRYFTTIYDKKKRDMALDTYPQVISRAYRRWMNSKAEDSWVIIPAEIGVCFPLFDGRPLFLNVIEATLMYDDALDTERERDLEEIKKIIVQKIPHLNDGGLLFEPEEAELMHGGAVGMLKGNKNLSVLTTYADVDAITSRTSNEAESNTVDKMLQSVYSEAGVSKEIFAATGSSSLATSLKNDLALMMVLGHKYSRFVTGLLNQLFANGNIDFTYQIMPISYYNDVEFANNSYKYAGMGYSFLLPALAMGLSQRDLVNVKALENDLIDISTVLVPISTAYTGGGAGTTSPGDANPVGRPALAEEEKSAKTLANERSLENTGQGEAE